MAKKIEKQKDRGARAPEAIKPITEGTWSDTATRVLRERYLLKNDAGEVTETPSQAMRRVADAIAQAELNYPAAESTSTAQENLVFWGDRFFEIMNSRKFMPNSPTLMNAGKNNGLQLSACYVVPVPDSLEGIFEAIKHAALIHKSGGGTGMSFSRLRPKNSFVGSTQGVSSGPVSFMRIFDAATENIKQGGTRRGANMGVLRVDHPDILEFINCKRDGSVTNFNISVGITDAFMAALDKPEGEDSYDLFDPRDRTKVVGQLSALKVMTEIIDAAWSTGDPGLIFIDRVNASPANPTPELEEIETTNPCGEQPLGDYDACNLGSINLGLFVKPDSQALPLHERIDWDGLHMTVSAAVRFLDNVIDMNPYPLPEVRAKVQANRRIGLGVMGWADMLFKLGVRYDSDEAIELGQYVMRDIQDMADVTSISLGVLRGNFLNHAHSRYHESHKFLRNSNRTTVAPTGTISIIADCSSGIEPIFALAFQHRVKQPDGSYRILDFVNPLFQEAIDKAMWDGDAKTLVLRHVSEHGSLNGLDWNTLDGWGSKPMPEELKPFVTAQEIEPKWHIAMQAAFQKSVDSAISKTINLPNEATRENVCDSYMQAWESGCLGITVFRDGCKGEQVLNVGVKKEEAKTEPTPEVTPEKEIAFREDIISVTQRNLQVAEYEIAKLKKEIEELAVKNKRLWAENEDLKHPGHHNSVKQRPSVVHGYTRQVIAPEGKVNVTLNSDDNGLLEIFVNVGRAGSDVAALAEALGRLTSLVLRIHSNLPQDERAREVARQLRGIGGSSSVGFGAKRVLSLPDAIASAIESHYEEAHRETEEKTVKFYVGVTSPASASDVDVLKNRFDVAMLPEKVRVEEIKIQVPVEKPAPKRRRMGNICSQCGNSTLVLEEGCKKCLSCGTSQC